MSRFASVSQPTPDEVRQRLQNLVARPTVTPAEALVAVAVPPAIRRLDRILFGGKEVVPLDPGGPDPTLQLGSDGDLARAELAGLAEPGRLAALAGLVQSAATPPSGPLSEALDAVLAAVPLAPGCLVLQLRLADLQLAAGLRGAASEKLDLLARAYALRGDRAGLARSARRRLDLLTGSEEAEELERYARLLAEHGLEREAAGWWAALARRRRLEGRPFEARSLAERAVAHAPDDPTCAVEWGLALLDLDLPAQAGLAFAQALAADPTHLAGAAYLLFVSALHDEPLDPLLARLATDARVGDDRGAAPGDPPARWAFLDDLLARAERALRADGRLAGLRRLLGTLCAAAGRTEVARHHWFALADLSARREGPAGEARALEQAVRLLPDDPLARRRLGGALLRLGQVGRALQELNAAAALELASAESAP